MRKYLLAAAAAIAVAAPASARDGSGYFGIEGGLLFPRDNDADIDVDYTTTQTPASPLAPAGPADASFDDAAGFEWNRGIDVDAIAGYDFGGFRGELELGYKRASLDEFGIDNEFITALNTALNRPSAAPDPGAPGFAPLDADDFDVDGRVTILSAMANALVDFGDEDALSFYAGGGFGRARVKLLGESDSAWAWQLIAGLRYALSPSMDVGLKYRYFNTGGLDLADDEGFGLEGNPDRFVIDVAGVPTNVDRTTDANVFADFEDRFRSHSLLASLIFNFGAAAPLPPPPPPPPPPPAAPATQTCPDGSVILATDICPAPPPPPPPPPPAGERG